MQLYIVEGVDLYRVYMPIPNMQCHSTTLPRVQECVCGGWGVEDINMLEALKCLVRNCREQLRLTSFGILICWVVVAGPAAVWNAVEKVRSDQLLILTVELGENKGF